MLSMRTALSYPWEQIFPTKSHEHAGEHSRLVKVLAANALLKTDAISCAMQVYCLGQNNKCLTGLHKIDMSTEKSVTRTPDQMERKMQYEMESGVYIGVIIEYLHSSFHFPCHYPYITLYYPI